MAFREIGNACPLAPRNRMRNYCFMALPEILSTFEDALRRRVTTLASELGSELARSERALSERFNQTARRLRLAETQAEWRTILLEAAAPFCAKAEVFFPGPALAAPAFAEVLESRETVVTLRDASQLSAPVAESLGPALSPRCYLFPILDAAAVAAILYAEAPADLLDRNALELLAALAAGSLPKAPPPPEPADAESKAAARLALQARRYARVRVAKMILSSPRRLERGRQDGNLYVIFKEDIDLGRLEFRRQFVECCPSMADYFHQELVHTLAKDDAKALGSEYPGATR
ncbi:MAG: hypothetical protein IT167_31770 [Bryobacterales bacterium]|nr:hypothetical protein [Bryobacterales bacterium]